MSERKLLRNSARCEECGEEIVSTHRHDFRTCGCGHLSVDGGREYAQRLFKTDNWTDTSTYEPESRSLGFVIIRNNGQPYTGHHYTAGAKVYKSHKWAERIMNKWLPAMRDGAAIHEAFIQV